ncbi:MAG: CoA protein activase [Chloroflexi bacterium]|nr:CoA protein activase [Chloroflexota bacterium]
MRLTFPHMGQSELVLSDFFTRVGTEFVAPPRTTIRTLQLGFRHAPEGACLPLKVTLGNMIEGLERGADTVLMLGGSGPCRLGYYAEAQRRMLQAAGYEFEMIVFEGPSRGFLRFIAECRRLAPKRSLWQMWKALKIAFQKASALDEIEKKVLEVRAYERDGGSTNRAWEQALTLMVGAQAPEEIDLARLKALALLDDVDKDVRREVLRVGIVGEFFILLEPFLKFDMEVELGHAGVYLERSIYTSSWANPISKHPVTGVTHDDEAAAARPYLNHSVGGDGLATVGNTVLYARRGFDGIVHLMPFTCMPDAIAKGIMRRVSRDLRIPVLTFVIDEHTGKAGIATRLEAFVDLLWAKRRQNARGGTVRGDVAGVRRR